MLLLFFRQLVFVNYCTIVWLHGCTNILVSFRISEVCEQCRWCIASKMFVIFPKLPLEFKLKELKETENDVKIFILSGIGTTG